MAKYQCVQRHFVAGGELVKVGDTASFDTCPGSMWQKVDAEQAKKLEVATPKKAPAKPTK